MSAEKSLISASRGVIISGWAHSSAVLDPLCDCMEDFYALETIPPGDLLSEEQPESCTEEEPLEPALSMYASALIRRLREESSPVVLMGWSAGAMIALEVAARLPEQVDALVLMSGTACFCRHDYSPWGFSPEAVDSMARQIERQPEPVLDDFFRRTASPTGTSTAAVDQKIDDALEEGTQHLLDGLSYLRDTDLATLAGEISQPCLLIHGKQDNIISAEATKHLHSLMPNSATVTLAEAGHNLPEQHAVTAAIYIQTFLSSL